MGLDLYIGLQSSAASEEKDNKSAAKKVIFFIQYLSIKYERLALS